jgi:hypothetical protein
MPAVLQTRSGTLRHDSSLASQDSSRCHPSCLSLDGPERVRIMLGNPPPSSSGFLRKHMPLWRAFAPAHCASFSLALYLHLLRITPPIPSAPPPQNNPTAISMAMTPLTSPTCFALDPGPPKPLLLEPITMNPCGTALVPELLAGASGLSDPKFKLRAPRSPGRLQTSSSTMTLTKPQGHMHLRLRPTTTSSTPEPPTMLGSFFARSAIRPPGGEHGLVTPCHWWQNRHLHGRKVARFEVWASLVTRCPICQVVAFITGVGCGRALPQPLLSLRGVLPVSDIYPAVASHLATSDPERVHPLITLPDITVQRCSSGPVVWGPK